jgi:hypothetical protein
MSRTLDAGTFNQRKKLQGETEERFDKLITEH